MSHTTITPRSAYRHDETPPRAGRIERSAGPLGHCCAGTLHATRAIPHDAFAWLESPDAAYRVRVALDPDGRAVAILPAPRASLVPERVPPAPLVMREERETRRPGGAA